MRRGIGEFVSCKKCGPPNVPLSFNRRDCRLTETRYLPTLVRTQRGQWWLPGCRLPIERRKQTLVRLLHGPYPGIAPNERFVGNGDIVFEQACQLGCEGIVSKRIGSLYRSGRSKQWLKGQEPGGAGGAARGGRGLGALTPIRDIAGAPGYDRRVMSRGF